MPLEDNLISPPLARLEEVEILPWCFSVTGPLVQTITPPAGPVPLLALEIELSDSTVSVPRVNCTEPAGAALEDEAEIAPPFSSNSWFPLTTTLPPFPALPGLPCRDAAKIPVSPSLPPVPSTIIEVAFTRTSPAFPEALVEDAILPRSVTSSLPAVTFTLPPAPVENAVVEITAESNCSTLVIIFTVPPSPLPSEAADIAALLSRETDSAVTLMLPPCPTPKLSVINAPPSRIRDAAVTFMLPPIPRPKVSALKLVCVSRAVPVSVNVLAVTDIVPPFPAASVSATNPALSRVIDLAVTVISPLFPLPFVLVSSALKELSTCNVSTAIATLPPLPCPLVAALITAPLSRATTAALKFMSPPSPLFSSVPDVSERILPLLRVMDSALAFMSPAFPRPIVLVEILKGKKLSLLTSRLPLATMLMPPPGTGPNVFEDNTL